MKKVLVSFTIGAIFGLLLCGCYCIFVTSSGCIDFDKKDGMPAIIYYLIQPISVLGTFLALLVAIFGTEIKNMFFSPKCKAYILGDGFEEDLGSTASSSSPSAQLYKCALVLKNTGSKELTDLSLVIKEVHFINENGKSKKISRAENTIFWLNPDIKKINLRETEQREIILARIFPEASQGTPDNSSKSPLRFSITGINLETKYNQKGRWVVKYCLQTPHKIIKTFQITLSWSGKWCSRINEMTNEVTSEFKEYKS